MNFNKAIDIAVGCVLTSELKNNIKRDVINKLRKIEEITELVEYGEYDDDSEIVDMIEKLLKTNTQYDEIVHLNQSVTNERRITNEQ